MHGNVERNSDNSLPFQLIVDFVFGRFVPIRVFEKLTSLNSRWAWVTPHNRGL
jgi:hypothetical protein